MTAMNAEATLNGETLQQLFAVTRQDLASRMNTRSLLDAAKGKDGALGAWIQKTGWTRLSDQLAGHLCGYLQVNLVTIFTGAWTRYAELRKYAAETAAGPASTASVALASHDFTYEVSPAIEVFVDRVKVAEIPFTIAITFTLNGLELTLKQGCISEVSSGTCECLGKISCADSDLWTGKVPTFSLPGHLELAKPISLM